MERAVFTLPIEPVVGGRKRFGYISVQPDELSTWRRQKVKWFPLSNQKQFPPRIRQSSRFVFGCDGGAEDATTASAYGGFPNCLNEDLSKLWTLAKVRPGKKKPTTLKPLLKGCIAHYLPLLTDDQIENIIDARGCSASTASVESELMEDGALSAVTNFLDEGDIAEVERTVSKAREEAEWKTGSRVGRLPQTAFGRVDPAPHLSRDWAATFLPDAIGCTITKDIV